MFLFLGPFFVALLLRTQVVFAIIEETAKEQACFNVSAIAIPDHHWYFSVGKWYYPLASRLDLYRSSHDLLEVDYELIPEYALYYDSCIKWNIVQDGAFYQISLTGYHGRIRHLSIAPLARGIINFQSEWSGGVKGTSFVTFTDNKSFIVTVQCFDDYQTSWNVISTIKTLDYATKKEIFDHVESLGFKPEYFTEIKYDSCGPDGNYYHYQE